MNQPFDLTGKVALVVGAGGLGGAQAVGLARAGADIAVGDVCATQLEQTRQTVERVGRRATAHQVDITRREDVCRLAGEVVAGHGEIDILVNAAGVTRRAPSEEFSEQEFDRILDVNLNGLFFTCQAVGKVMIAQGGGRIINMASIFAEVGNPESVAYAASKGAVAQVTRTLALEWTPYNIAVNAISPSWFDTSMAAGLNDTAELYKGSTVIPSNDEVYKRTVGRVPFKRMGLPEEIVGATVFLASDAASMVTGHLLAVDGGYLAG